MCRLAAYLGPRIPLAQFLLQPPHSLVRQSYHPREMREARVNADGFGFGWFDGRGRPARYVNVFPIWSDTNLGALGEALHANAWVGAVRSATPGIAHGAANTQPFHDDRYLFLHNGYLRDFARRVRPQARAFLHPEIENAVDGNSDSEYLFAALRQLLLDSDRVERALVALATLAAAWDADGPALLTIVVTDGRRLYALRHAVNGEPPTLYYALGLSNFPHGALLASEPLTADGDWRALPAHAFAVLEPGHDPRVTNL